MTRNVKMTILERAIKDPDFRNGLLEEACNEYLLGHDAVGKELMLDYINASIVVYANLNH